MDRWTRNQLLTIDNNNTNNVYRYFTKYLLTIKQGILFISCNFIIAIQIMFVMCYCVIMCVMSYLCYQPVYECWIFPSSTVMWYFQCLQYTTGGSNENNTSSNEIQQMPDLRVSSLPIIITDKWWKQHLWEDLHFMPLNYSFSHSLWLGSRMIIFFFFQNNELKSLKN